MRTASAATISFTLLLLTSTPAFAQTPVEQPHSDGPALHIVIMGFITAASTDLAVSTYQIGRGAGRERGFGAPWQDSPVAFGITKSAMSAAFVYGIQHVHKTRPKTAIVLGVAATAVEGWLVARGAALTPPAR
jgi:hypothetical protein